MVNTAIAVKVVYNGADFAKSIPRVVPKSNKTAAYTNCVGKRDTTGFLANEAGIPITLTATSEVETANGTAVFAISPV